MKKIILILVMVFMTNLALCGETEDRAELNTLLQRQQEYVNILNNINNRIQQLIGKLELWGELNVKDTIDTNITSNPD